MIHDNIWNILQIIPTGEQTRCCGPGDIVTISGVFLSERLTGYRAIKAGLQSNVYVESLLIEKQKLGYNDVHNDKAAELAVRYDKRKKNEIQNKIIIFHICYNFFLFEKQSQIYEIRMSAIAYGLSLKNWIFENYSKNLFMFAIHLKKIHMTSMVSIL